MGKLGTRALAIGSGPATRPRFLSRVDPARTVGREPSAGDDAVDVRVEEQLARPGVQHRRKPELEERLRRAREEHGEELLAAKAHECTQLRGEREYCMKVTDRQDAFLALGDPLRLREALALGTVPVPTRVVGRCRVREPIAHVEVTAQSGGAAAHDVAQHRCLVGRQGMASPTRLLKLPGAPPHPPRPRTSSRPTHVARARDPTYDDAA